MPVRPPFLHALLSRAPQKKTKQPPPHVKAPALGFPLRHRAQSEGGLGGGPPRGRSESGCIPISQGASAAAAAASLLLFWGARVRVVGLA